MDTQITNVPHWKLRRIAPRALRALEAHKAQAPSLQSFEHSLTAAVGTFVEVYDASRNVSATSQEVEQGQQAISQLKTLVKSWLGPLSRDIPGLDAKGLAAAAVVPDDLLGGAQRVLEIVRSFESEPGKSLPYKAEFEKDFGGAVEAAAKEWSEANARHVRQQDLLRKTRQAAVTLNAELVAFRRSLRAVLGAEHRDYQQLRIRGQIADAVVPVAATEVAPTVTVTAVATAVASTPAPAPAVNGLNGSNGAIKEVATA